MPYPMFSFTGQGNPDPSAQQGMNQYIQQGQSMIDPGHAAVQASDPVNAAAKSMFANALQNAGKGTPAQQPFMPQQNIPNAYAMSPPGQQWGMQGTPQNVALGNMLAKMPQTPNEGITY